MIFEEIIKDSGEETSGHCLRVSEYTKIFLSKDNYGYTQKEKDFIIRGAFLHDIGKSKIDKELLYKPNGLTPEEFIVIQRHSIYGYEILAQHKNLFSCEEEYEICSNIALLHHRRFDNTGYPLVPHQELDDYLQIVSILDVYDALTSKRCYQTPVTRKEALEIIAQGKGGFFQEELTENLPRYIDFVL